MRSFIRILVALAYLASATLAQSSFLVNSYNYVVGGGGTPASISFVGCTGDSTDQTTYTYTNHATGTAGTRKTIVGVGSSDSATNFSISSMTVGGASATEVVDSADAGSVVQAGFYIIDNPSGTTATIVVTMSEAVTSVVVCVWAAYDVVSETANATASEFQTSSAACTISLNVPTDGIGVGMATASTNTSSWTWSGMTERVDAGLGATELTYTGADTATAGTPLAVTADATGTQDSIGVSASFR